MNARATSSRAFTLIETISVIIILAVAVPPMILALRDAAVRSADPVLASRARWLAAERLEDIIADRHSPSRGYAYVVSGNYPAESTISGFAGFSRSVTITETNATLSNPGTGYKLATVTVTWLSPVFGSESFAVSTVITDYTP
jgi:hypothetical protein